MLFNYYLQNRLLNHHFVNLEGATFQKKMFQNLPDSLCQKNHSHLAGFFPQKKYLFVKNTRKKIMNYFRIRPKILISPVLSRINTKNLTL